jgi:protein associated with RNAse G/E
VAALNDKFTEYKRTYFGETKIFQCRLVERKEDEEVVLLYEITAPAKFVDINFPEGSKSYGYFWADKNYNVYHWVDLRNKTILFYFNISKDTRILQSSVEWKDMIVDIAAFPSGKKNNNT